MCNFDPPTGVIDPDSPTSFALYKSTKTTTATAPAPQIVRREWSPPRRLAVASLALVGRQRVG